MKAQLCLQQGKDQSTPLSSDYISAGLARHDIEQSFSDTREGTKDSLPINSGIGDVPNGSNSTSKAPRHICVLPGHNEMGKISYQTTSMALAPLPRVHHAQKKSQNGNTASSTKMETGVVDDSIKIFEGGSAEGTKKVSDHDRHMSVGMGSAFTGQMYLEEMVRNSPKAS